MVLNWKITIVDKLWDKHHVVPEEVEEAFKDLYFKRLSFGHLLSRFFRCTVRDIHRESLYTKCSVLTRF